MTTTENTTAIELRRQVRGIANTLEKMIGLLDGSHDFTREDETFLIDQGCELSERLAGVEDDDEAEELRDIIREHLEEWPLEVIQHATRPTRQREWEYSHSVVVFCTGGPHVELSTRDGVVRGYWGGDSCTALVSDDVNGFYEDLFDTSND